MLAIVQANHARWLSGQPLDMLDREAVERDVAAADKVLHKTVRAFAARGLDRMVANVEAVKQQVEAFKPVVPLVQVRLVCPSCCWCPGPAHLANSQGRAMLRSLRNLLPIFPPPGLLLSVCLSAVPSCKQSLRDPGMRARHWDQLSADLGTDAHFPPAFTLEAALGQGLLAHLPAISRVAELASKEFSIEQVR